MKKILNILWMLLPMWLFATNSQLEVECGKQYKVTAVAEKGSRFVRWSDGETANPRIVTATEDMTFTAIFEYIPIQENCPYSGICGENLTWELNCDGLLSISGTGEMTSSPWLAYRDFITSVIIYNGVTSIADAAFSGCTGLTSIIIPSNLSNIGRGILSDCDALSNIETPAMYFNEGVEFDIFTIGATRPNKLESIIINGGELTSEGFDFIRESYRSLTSIDMSQAENTTLPDVALRDCYNLRSIKLPAALEQIGYMAVAECKNLQSVDIPASVTEISQSAFENCRSLSTINFGLFPQLRHIDNWAFYNCHALQNLEIPAGVTEIGDGAFYGCTYMENLSLPASIQTIGDNTFSLCTKMKKMMVDAVIPPSIQAKTFFEVDRQTPVYVPDESVDAYKSDAYWKEFFIQGRSDIPTSIDDLHADTDKPVKLFMDGHIFILRGDHIYDTQGKMVR